MPILMRVSILVLAGLLQMGTGPFTAAAQVAAPDDESRRAERDRAAAMRAADERPYDHRRPAEWYVAGFGGYTFGHAFNNVQGTNGMLFGDVDLKNSAVYGGKLGYFFHDRWSWLGVEVEAFNSTPHLKRSAIGPGADLRVTTLAFNVIARGQYDCRTDRDQRATRPTEAEARRGHLYTDHHFCRLQPYAGVGLGVYFASLDGGLTGGRSVSDNAVPGFNGLAGLRYYFTEHVAAFAEYKYNRATFTFDNAVGATNGLQGDYSVSHVVGGLSFHF
ncbi:outer membrane protein [Candidatus Nitrospira bockiana]